MNDIDREIESDIKFFDASEDTAYEKKEGVYTFSLLKAHVMKQQRQLLIMEEKFYQILLPHR